MTDHDTGGTLDGWDDELTDWTDANRHADQRAYESDATEAALTAANICIRPFLGDERCKLGYDHTGRCDWFGPTYDRIVADAVAKAQS